MFRLANNRKNQQCLVALLPTYLVKDFRQSICCRNYFTTSIKSHRIINLVFNKVVKNCSTIKDNDIKINETKSAVNLDDISTIPGVKSEGDKLIMFYTCKVCDTRSVKKISKHGYEHGVVVVRCPQCDSMHLIADRLGIFEDGKDWDIQKYLTSQGEAVKVVNDEVGVLELTNSDIIGSLEGRQAVKDISTATIVETISSSSSIMGEVSYSESNHNHHNNEILEPKKE